MAPRRRVKTKVGVLKVYEKSLFINGRSLYRGPAPGKLLDEYTERIVELINYAYDRGVQDCKLTGDIHLDDRVEVVNPMGTLTAIAKVPVLSPDTECDTEESL